ncbi:MAG: glycosyltransferase WbuB, partial [Cyanobacteria bacterium P01_C01_bin.38]
SAIIASVPDNGTAARAIRQSGGGKLVPPEEPSDLADAVLDLYKHPEKVKTLGYNSRKYAVEQYAFEQALNNYESLFESVKENSSTIDAIVSKQEV